MNPALNFILSQIGWFACVLGAANGWPLAGALVALALIALHLWAVAEPRLEAALIVVAGGLGLLLDSLLLNLGLTRYPSGMLSPYLAPYWIVAMWMLFATTLNLSLRWLKDRSALAALFGALGGPLAFYAGHRLGAVDFAEPQWHSLAALAVTWALAMPLVFALAARWDGTVSPRPAAER